MPPPKSVTFEILRCAAEGLPVELRPLVGELLDGLIHGGYVITDIEEDVVHPSFDRQKARSFGNSRMKHHDGKRCACSYDPSASPMM